MRHTHWLRRIALGLFLFAAAIQSCLPILSQPSIKISDSGRVVLLCTYQGLVQVNLGTSNDESPKPENRGHWCPACLLQKSGSAPLAPLSLRALPQALPVSLAKIAPTVLEPRRETVLRNTPIRAPPLA